jgi:hypothetical protein
VDANWSLTKQKGALTLHTISADSLKVCRQLLTQKVMGYEGEATLQLTTAPKDGLRCGLAFTGKQFRAIGLSAEGIYTEEGGRYTLVKRCKVSKVWLRVAIDSRRNLHRFQYSIDGSHYESAGDAFPMQEGYWKGIRVGLYAYHTKGSSQTVWFDRFQYDVLH